MGGSGGIIGDWEAPLNRDQIMRIIPHRDPFLFLDEIIELTPGESAVAKRLVRPEEPQFTGHFPQEAIMPGVLILEAMAQAGAVAALTPLENDGKMVLFAGADKVRWKKKVAPGNLLILSVKLSKMIQNVGKAEAQAFVINPKQLTWDKKDLACKAEIMFAIADWEK